MASLGELAPASLTHEGWWQQGGGLQHDHSYYSAVGNLNAGQAMNYVSSTAPMSNTYNAAALLSGASGINIKP